MGNVINLDAERAKRGKLRGFVQVEHIIVRHDGYLATDCGDEMLRHAELLRRMAEFGDYPNG